MNNNGNNAVCSSVPFTNVKIDSAFWNRILDKHHGITIHTVVDRCFDTKRVENFIKAGRYLELGMDKELPKELEFEGRFYDDSDVFKAIEGAAYTLMQYKDEELEKKIDTIIEAIVYAQWPDGYLMTYYTIHPEEKGKRWSDMDRHEMYNGGHMIEAAVAYFEATGKTKLLDSAKKMVEHWMHTFGEGRRHWVEGHPEPELALVKLYELTKDRRYLDFAVWLLSERGHGHYASKGRAYRLGSEELFYRPEYHQDHLPLEKQSFVCGHAVRAMYMYTGMADVAKYTGKKEYIAALDKIWENIALRNMYITGGIGSSRDNEGFTVDFDLPNMSAYAETCAAIGMALFNHRMNLLHEDAKYADVIEKELYNGVLAGVSLSGDKFFYVNPMEVSGKPLEEGGHRRRQEWFTTSCCPTNLARFIPCVSQYIYALSKEKLYINQYIGSSGCVEIDGTQIKIQQETNYPWEGGVRISFHPEKPVHSTLCFRVPDWCDEYSFNFTGKICSGTVMKKGYICINVELDNYSVLELNFSMQVKKMRMDPRVAEDFGKVALQRGPIVYVFEEEDNPLVIDDILIARDTLFGADMDLQMLGGIMKLNVITESRNFLAVPYYAWDNRKLGKMRMFVPEKIDNARANLI